MKRRTRLSLETLESRCTPAVSTTVGHSLWIKTGDAGETVTVSDATVAAPTGTGTIKAVVVTEQVGNSAVKTTTIDMTALTGGHVYFYGSKGDDHFTNQSSLQLIAYGGRGNDTFSSRTASFIYAGAGDNVIDCHLATGVCVLHGGAGDDTIYGGGGVNQFYGDSGNDTIVADPHGTLNYLIAGTGKVALTGGNGTNYLYGGAGNDTLVGGAGATVTYLISGSGNSTLIAGGGLNYLFGGAGNDTLIGGAGTNYLYGGTGTDYLYGGSGENFLDGGHHGTTDQLVGGTGRNHFRQDIYYNGSVYVNRAIISNYDAGKDVLTV